jgi:xanthine dehydrogenase accessory factor
MIAATPIAILQAALDWAQSGDPVALVTLTGIEGSSSRALGAQMAVTASGQSIGSFSGGCIEAAIIAEAQKVLAEGEGRVVRYGLGSPYIDVRLPCGGGIDLLFTPRPDAAVLVSAFAQHARREPLEMRITPTGVSLAGEGFGLRINPDLRVMAFGQGEDLSAFCWLAERYGVRLEAFSPVECDLSRMPERAETHHLTSTGQSLALQSDPYTAHVFLFHDRDWEDALIPQILPLDGFYQGAIGSQRTHQARLARLTAAGVPPEQLAKLRGHIGLIHATRDPATLALSVLADIIAAAPVAFSG